MNLMDFIINDYKTVASEKYLGIFGNPIKHTLSPIIHDTLSDSLNIKERYVPFQVPKEELGACVKAAFDEGIVGLNITVPYKQDVMAHLVEIDEAAKAIGAVNTLVRMEDGFKGYNTDMPGLARAIMDEGITLEGKNVIMLGAGGAARAVAYMCGLYKTNKVYIVNRTYENAKNISDSMNEIFGKEYMIPVAAADYAEIPVDKYLMIQCTSVGLHETDGLPLVSEESFYDQALFGIDLIYNPAKTPFIRLLEDKGIPAANGLKMLLYQGIMAYELWNKVEITKEQSDLVYGKLCEHLYGKKIVLIGYMGSGKTTVGKKIASDYGYAFVDTDEMIVEEAGMSIADIFEKYGETHFREIETKILEKLMDMKGNVVVSTGGGLPLKENNRKMLKNIGKVYYLHTNADTVYDRVKGDVSRPLLMCEDPYKRICEMLEERDPIYRLAMDVLIDVNDQKIGEIASKIIGF